MNQGWTPIFGKLVASTLWSESKEVKILFVTMLALKDADGVVTGTAEGLRRIADLTIEETVEALRVLEAPDTKTSEPQEFEGRRIKKVDDGWLILNHFKYRDMVATLRRKEQQRQAQAKRRALALGRGIAESPDGSGCSDPVAEAAAFEALAKEKGVPESTDTVAEAELKRVENKVLRGAGEAVEVVLPVVPEKVVVIEKTGAGGPDGPGETGRNGLPGPVKPVAVKAPVPHEESWAINMERRNAALRGVELPVAPVVKAVQKPGPARRVVVDAGQPRVVPAVSGGATGTKKDL